jgi:hypothetical protein
MYAFKDNHSVSPTHLFDFFVHVFKKIYAHLLLHIYIVYI